jgi:hypothetical protein
VDLNWKYVLLIMFVSFTVVLVFEGIVTAEVVAPVTERPALEKSCAFEVEADNTAIEVERCSALLDCLIKEGEAQGCDTASVEKRTEGALASIDSRMDSLRSKF